MRDPMRFATVRLSAARPEPSHPLVLPSRSRSDVQQRMMEQMEARLDKFAQHSVGHASTGAFGGDSSGVMALLRNIQATPQPPFISSFLLPFLSG